MDEMLVSVTLNEVRIAFLSQNVLRETYVEKRNQQSLTGNIYSGRVRRILPELQAVFVDMGFARPGFLHVKDMAVLSGKEYLSAPKLGDRFPVQVIKDPLGAKGARLSTFFTLPGRFLVLTPGVFSMRVSQKITDESEVQRLSKILQPSRFGGYILRTQAGNAPVEALLTEQRLLDSEWEKIKTKMQTQKPGECLHREPGLACRILRDLANENTSIRIRVDNSSLMKEMTAYASCWCPNLVSSIELYEGVQPLFELSGVERGVQQALQRRVYLKSGGYLVFDQTEAMTTIDVNTGSILSGHQAENIVFRTNQEAVGVIAHQVRLRHLGGIIIIDFIDMTKASQRESLLASLMEAFRDDTAHTEFSELTRLGLVQMTRRRARESLLHTICEPCPFCQRRGMIRTPATVACEIIRALQSEVSSPWSGFRVQLAPEVAGFFMEHAPQALSEISVRLGKTVELHADQRYHREKWDILPLGIHPQSAGQKL